jgi:chromate transporter
MTNPPTPPEEGDTQPEVERLGPVQLFVGFSQMALSGFGGVMPFAYRFLVEQRLWVSAEDFAEMFAFGQILPGPTICNVSVMVGWRKAGIAGALAALAGILIGPIIVVLLLGAAYQTWGSVPAVQAALAGMSAVAAGLIIATAVKMGIALFRSRRGLAAERLWLGVFAVLAFAGVGLLRWPLVAVVAALGPCAILLSVWRRK